MGELGMRCGGRELHLKRGLEPRVVQYRGHGSFLCVRRNLLTTACCHGRVSIAPSTPQLRRASALGYHRSDASLSSLKKREESCHPPSVTRPEIRGLTQRQHLNLITIRLFFASKTTLRVQIEREASKGINLRTFVETLHVQVFNHK